MFDLKFEHLYYILWTIVIKEKIYCDNMTYLSGRLEIYIDQAENLTNTETSCCGRGVYSDPYVTGKLGEDKIFKTKMLLIGLNKEH